METVKVLIKEGIHKHLRTIIDLTIIVILSIIIFRRWLFTIEWPAGGDTLGWISREYLFGNGFRWLYTWVPTSFGFVQGIDSMDFFLMLIHLIFKDAATTVKILFFSLFLISGFTMYAFAYNYTSRNISSLSASLIYLLNQWLFSQFTEGHLHILFSYALIPMVFLLLDRTLKNRNFKNALKLALISCVFITGSHPQSIIIYGLFLIMYVASFLITKSYSLIEIKSVLKTISITGGIIFLLSAFTIIPALLNVRASYLFTTYTHYLEDAYSASYKTMDDAFTLKARLSWGYNNLIYTSKDISLPDFNINAILFLIFILSFCIVFFRTDRYTMFFAFSTMISTFIAKGPNPPFGDIFTWMWLKIPYFSAFRSASRAVMMTAFSHAFLVSVLVSILVRARASYAEKEEVYLKAKARNFGEKKDRPIFFSIDVINKALKILKKLLNNGSFVLVLFIFLNGFGTCFYFFMQGLQVYTPPEEQIEPYNWLANQTGDFKVITASNSPSEWDNLYNQLSDFAFGGMKNSIGWGHDIGFDSSFIHDKPVLQDGGWTPSTRHYVDYLRFRLVRRDLTKSFFKMMGAFNYKYIVLPEYLSKRTRNFFLHQEGYQVAYNQSSVILENEYYTPRFYAVNERAYIVGGLETIPSLYTVDTFNLNQTALIFAHQMNEAPFTQKLFNNSEALILTNSDIVDAAMLSLKNEGIFIRAVDFGMPSTDYSKYWGISDSWRNVGTFVWGTNTLTTSGENSIRIPFKVVSDGVYDVWIRLGFADNRGKLNILLDGNPVGRVQPSSHTWSKLMWVKITSLDLKRGDHKITLTNDGKGYNDLDMIAILKSEIFKSKIYDLLNTLKNFSGRIVHILGAINTFTLDPPPDFQLNIHPYEGHFIYSTNTGVNMAPKGYASASSVGVWDTVDLGPNAARDGDLETRWASKPFEKMPQWLQIEWDEQQELNGVEILFEWAYAGNYTIQTWNGTNWVDQVKVRGNTILNRLHYFRTVNTTKIRIYVTNVSKLHDLVSIFELKAFKPQGFSTEIWSPREGRYMFAIRLATGLNYATATIQVDNFTESTYCWALEQDYEWRHFGPIKLDEGLHKITVHGIGKIEFDKVVVYSLNEGEESLSLDEVFRLRTPERSFWLKYAPEITYKQINPSKYIVHVENNIEPFLLIFSEAYHHLWKAYVYGEEISSIPAYSMVNSFYIDKMGSYDVTIYFTGQTYANYGLKISLPTLVIVVVVLLIPTRKLEKIGKYITSKYLLLNLQQKG